MLLQLTKLVMSYDSVTYAAMSYSPFKDASGAQTKHIRLKGKVQFGVLITSKPLVLTNAEQESESSQLVHLYTYMYIHT